MRLSRDIALYLSLVWMGLLVLLVSPAASGAQDEGGQTRTALQTAPSKDSGMTKQVAVLTTNKGTITLELLPELAPEHVKNFVDLASSGFYDGTKFHRVIPGFMIQGGDPNSKTDKYATWGTGNGPRRLKAEFSPAEKASHTRGAVSMARANDPDSASCQFFIVHQDSKFLDGKYSIFARVLSGLETVDAIAATKTNEAEGRGGRPLEDVVIESIKIETR